MATRSTKKDDQGESEISPFKELKYLITAGFQKVNSDFKVLDKHLSEIETNEY